MRNLHKVQAGRGVNAPGVPEISETVFEELLVNALVHRDYLVSAPIRIFVLEDRIEIISPGHLPNNLTVEKIRRGNSIIRNPILVSYVAKGLLPYHGLGSGIKRALEEWPQIDFTDDREGCLFTATVYRTIAVSSGESSVKVSVKTGEQILGRLSENAQMTIPDLARILGLSTRAVEKQIAKLKKDGRLRRVGSRKAGKWEVLGVEE
jgi:ATP-dependent DNA helicase RecG